MTILKMMKKMQDNHATETEGGADGGLPGDAIQGKKLSLTASRKGVIVLGKGYRPVIFAQYCPRKGILYLYLVCF
jgi:hypothetical protein